MSDLFGKVWENWIHKKETPLSERQALRKAKQVLRENNDAKQAEEKKTRDARVAEFKKKLDMQPTTDEKQKNNTLSELPDANILERMREMLIESTCVESTPLQLRYMHR